MKFCLVILHVMATVYYAYAVVCDLKILDDSNCNARKNASLHCTCETNCFPIIIPCESYNNDTNYEDLKRCTGSYTNAYIPNTDHNLLTAYEVELNKFSFKCKPGYELHGLINVADCVKGKLNATPSCEPTFSSATSNVFRRFGVAATFVSILTLKTFNYLQFQ